MQFRPPAAKLCRLSNLARDMPCIATRRRRHVPAKLLASLAGQGQFLYLVMPPARFYLPNAWADKLSREKEYSDWMLNPRIFRYVDRIWGPHTVDHFATMEIALVPRYNSRWTVPGTEAADFLAQSDATWRADVN
eukprot:jgi/Tetstr1/464430/TSEL_000103.t1